MSALKTLLIGGVLAATLGGAASAIESDAFTYATKQTGYRSVAPGELVPTDAQSAANFRSGSQYFTSDTEGVRVCGQAPLNLPHGAVVQNVGIQYSVTSPSGNGILLQVYRRETFAPKSFTSPDDYEYLIGETLSNNGGVIGVYTEKAFAEYAKIDNEKYIYILRVCADQFALAYSARVKYTYRNAGE